MLSATELNDYLEQIAKEVEAARKAHAEADLALAHAEKIRAEAKCISAPPESNST